MQSIVSYIRFQRDSSFLKSINFLIRFTYRDTAFLLTKYVYLTSSAEWLVCRE